MKLYIVNKSSDIGLDNCFSLYGTNTYYNVWEKMCCFVLNDLKNKPLNNLQLPVDLNEKYQKNKDLASIIETPLWYSYGEEGEFHKDAKKNKLKPDLITIYQHDDYFNFLILDAKYYNLQLEKNLPLEGQPGIESVIKQYLYQLAYKEFIELHEFEKVKNCFLFPSNEDKIINKGFVKLNMLNNEEIENIQIILIPARKINQLYLDKKRLCIDELNIH